MAKPPRAVRESVLVRLYQEFDSLQWEQLGQKERSDAYERFLSDSEVGGALDPYVEAGRVRVWIKDGPAKEYIRALEGVGPYAKYTRRAYPSPQQVIQKALGDDWALEPKSVGDKPMRCCAVSEAGDRRFIIWGPMTALKELVWHALLQKVKSTDPKPMLVVTRATIAQLRPEEKELAESLCEAINADFKTITRTTMTKPGHEGV